MKAIELKNITFSYEGYDEKVLNGIAFHVNYGEVTLLSGMSGEGKSTVLSIIAGIIPNVTPGKVDGEVLINGQSIEGKKISEICRQVGIVLQNADAQIVQQIVEDEIAFGCENFAFPAEYIHERVCDSCRMMKIAPEWKTRLLSGGQKQRLITASTLATEQKIIVLDEPLANLDKEGACFLMENLKKLAQIGYAVLVVEHRLDMVLPHADAVWNIRSGVISKIVNQEDNLSLQSMIITDTCPKMEHAEELLRIENLNFSVKNRVVLSDISLTIKKGERVLLLGDNGCGKTTLMRLIARLYKPTSGCIVQNIGAQFKQKCKTNRKWFKRVGVVYQNPNYQLFMPTVWQEIVYNAVSVGYATEIMQLFGIEHLKTRHPHSLSEGQKRRVTIAAVAAGKPDIILLDEPTVGQDYDGLKDMVTILNQLHHRSGNTMIVITHDMRCAESLCDRTFLIQDGIVKKEGGKELARKYFSDNLL